MYDYKSGKGSIINILTTKTDVKKSNCIPKDEKNFNLSNAFLTDVGSIFIDIKKSSILFDTKDEKLARLMRAFTSEIITIFQSFNKYRQIGIRGDCVYAIYEVQNVSDLLEIFNIAKVSNTFMKMFNKILKNYGYENIMAGIGLGFDKELIIKSGRKGTGVTDKIWIGKAVVDASNLSSIANRDGVNPIAMSETFYNKISPNRIFSQYKNKIKFSKNYYHCDIKDVAFEKWIDNGMKG